MGRYKNEPLSTNEQRLDFEISNLKLEIIMLKEAEKALENILKHAANLTAAKHYAKFYFKEKYEALSKD
jgi:hypothetical protein